MGERSQQRVKAVLPIRVHGRSSSGNLFDEITYTLDISRAGARIILRNDVVKGDVLTVSYKQRKAPFEVKWLSVQRDRAEKVVGLLTKESSYILWSEIRQEEKTDYSDVFANKERERQQLVLNQRPVLASASPASEMNLNERAPGPSAVSTIQAAPAEVPCAAQTLCAVLPSSSPEADFGVVEEQELDEAALVQPGVDMSRQVKQMTANLLAFEGDLRHNVVNPEGLQSFRDALSKVRETAWILQQRLVLETSKDSGSDLPLISLINNDRLRTGARLCEELMQDFTNADLLLDKNVVMRFLAIAEQIVFELALAMS